MGGNNWFKKHNIKIENFKGGFITFADGTIGIIDIMSNGYGRSESAYVYYKTYKNTKFEKHINDIKPFKVYCDMTTDGGGWTAIKYTYDLSQKPVASKEHLTKNYYLDRDTVLKLLDLSSTFLFREDDSNTLAKLKPEAYPYIKSNIEGKHGWFMDTYGNDDLTAWMTPIDGKNIPDAKMKGCDNFRGKSYDYMYKYVLDSCNNYYGSHFNLYDFHRMRGGAYYTKRKNFLYIGGSKSTTTIPQATVKTTTDTKSRQRYYYCPSGYYQTSNNCYKYTYSCPSGYTPDGNRCSKKVVSCPSGYNHSHIYAACYGVGSNYNEYTRPASGACRSGYRPGGAYRNGRYIHCVRYIPEIIKKAYTSKVRSKTTTGLRSYYGCPSGYSASGSQCVKTITTHTCPTGYKYSGSRCVLK